MTAGWFDHDNGMGTVTEAWDEWFFIDRDQRQYLEFTLSLAAERYDAEWARAQREPGYADGPDVFDVFYSRVGGLLPIDHEWMTLAAVLRDAMTAYEVYVSKAIDEVLSAHGLQRKNTERTPGWAEMARTCKILGLKPNPEPVKQIIELRDILTHRRGELRTQSDRDRFGEGSESFGRLAHLTRESVLGYLDQLGAMTRLLDPVLWAYSWGRFRAKPLQRARS